MINSNPDKYKYIIDIDNSKIDNMAKYLHITANNTIFGTMYENLPELNIPLLRYKFKHFRKKI